MSIALVVSLQKLTYSELSWPRRVSSDATGLSPEAMRTRFSEVDWKDAFNDAPARRYVAFRQKEDDDRPLFKLEFGVGRDGLGFPSGFVAGTGWIQVTYHPYPDAGISKMWIDSTTHTLGNGKGRWRQQ
jgi:hypothetical protein